MLTRLQQRASIASLRCTPMILAANPRANFSSHDTRTLRINRGLFLATPRRVFSSDAEKELTDAEQAQAVRETEPEPMEAVSEELAAELSSGES